MIIIGGAVLFVIVVIILFIFVFSDKEKDEGLSGIVSTTLSAALKESYTISDIHPKVNLTVTLTFTGEDITILSEPNRGFISHVGLEVSKDGNNYNDLTTTPSADSYTLSDTNNSIVFNFSLEDLEPNSQITDTSTYYIRPYYIKNGESTKIPFDDSSRIILDSANTDWSGLVSALETLDTLLAFFGGAGIITLWNFNANSTSTASINYDDIPDGTYRLQTAMSVSQVVKIEVDDTNDTVTVTDSGNPDELIFEDVKFVLVDGVDDYFFITDGDVNLPTFYGRSSVMAEAGKIITTTNQLTLANDDDFKMQLKTTDGSTVIFP